MANNQKKYASLSTLSALVDNIKKLFATKIDLNTGLSGKADSTHKHSISDTTNLQTTLDGKVPTTRTINSKPLTANITLSASDVGASASGHTHDDRYYTETEVDTKLSGKSDSTHTHNYAGSSSVGGAATSANKLNTNAGSATHPVYFANGIPVETTYTLGKSVPSNAVFTDTTYNNASTSANGLMSIEDKTKLDATNFAYGTCSTAAATAAKSITISGNDKWTLTTGSIIAVRFDNSNTASNVTLNVKGTGAYPIWYNNAEYTDTGTAYTGYANRTIVYMFNGTHYVWITSSYDANSTYTNASLGQGYATCSTAASTTAKVGTLSNYKLVTGGIVSVKFTNAVPANATLNINSTGAKDIYYRGAKITSNIIKAGDVATFVYSSKYHLISIDRWQEDITGLKTYTDSVVAQKTQVQIITLEDDD